MTDQPSAVRQPLDYQVLKHQIKGWGAELGFAEIGIADIELEQAERRLQDWLARGWHGEMAYMAAHGQRRSRPAELVPHTQRVICARLEYRPAAAHYPDHILNSPELGYVSRYALGRDYHKLMRKRLQQLATRIEQAIGPFGYRVFSDSAPVMEKPLAQKAGLGWIGKHTNLISRHAGSWFFLGEIYTDLPLPPDAPAQDHCGSCRACLDVCPTQAIVAPYQLDARRCISYLTIELRGSIPLEFRRAMGNRIYGCDDCQLVCPWNKFARTTSLPDFAPRHRLDAPSLIELFGWCREEFERYTEGSAIRRIGHACWLRNIAVALGNADYSEAIVQALRQRLEEDENAIVLEHVRWALAEQEAKRITPQCDQRRQ